MVAMVVMIKKSYRPTVQSVPPLYCRMKFQHQLGRNGDSECNLFFFQSFKSDADEDDDEPVVEVTKKPTVKKASEKEAAVIEVGLVFSLVISKTMLLIIPLLMYSYTYQSITYLLIHPCTQPMYPYSLINILLNHVIWISCVETKICEESSQESQQA